jgi:hypothetical protein
MLSLGYMKDEDAWEAELGEAALEGFGLGTIGRESEHAMERSARGGDDGIGVMGQEAALKSGSAGVIVEGAELDSKGRSGLRGRRRDDGEANGANAGANESDVFGGALGEIDDAALDEGATIVDADLSAFAIGLIEDIDPGIKGKAEMSGSESAHVIDLAIGGTAAMIGFAIPAGEATFGVARLNVDERRRNAGDRTAASARGAQDEREAHKYRGAKRLEHERRT